MRVTRVTCFARAIAIVVAILISSGQFFFIAIQTKAEDAKAKHRGLSNDQKITQLLTRLTFGIRPGDFEYVKAIGINEFIAQQLNPESMKDSGLDERLRKLPTLTIGTPELIEQYTPPKATPSPSPQASMPVLPSPATATSVVAGQITPSLTTLGAEQQMKMDKTEPQDSIMRNQVTVQAMNPAGGEAMKDSQPSTKPLPRVRFLAGHGFRILFSSKEDTAAAWKKITAHADQSSEIIAADLLSRRK